MELIIKFSSLKETFGKFEKMAVFTSDDKLLLTFMFRL
jgi:hypothetical protein